MLSAAGHILEDNDAFPKSAVLLADILPTFILKLTAPFFMHRISYTIRVCIVVCFGTGAFLMTALLVNIWLRLLGVIFASISAGFGEVTFLAVSSYYHRNTVSAWSSGTGGAGVFGSLMYLAMTAWAGLSPKVTLITGSFFPLGIALSYFFLLSKPFQAAAGSRGAERSSDLLLTYQTVSVEDDPSAPLRGTDATAPVAVPAKLTMRQQLALIRPLLRYILPLVLVYYAEYVINQGVSPTIYFSKPFKNQNTYYVYYQFLYQSGVFASRSSVNFAPIKRIWIPAVLQCVNLLFLLAHAYWLFLPSAYIVFAIIFWEGLLGGSTYVNAFYLISQDVAPEHREFSLGVASVGDSMGIVGAALTGFLVEPWLRSRHRALERRGIRPAH